MRDTQTHCHLQGSSWFHHLKTEPPHSPWDGQDVLESSVGHSKHWAGSTEGAGIGRAPCGFERAFVVAGALVLAAVQEFF